MKISPRITGRRCHPCALAGNGRISSLSTVLAACRSSRAVTSSLARLMGKASHLPQVEAGPDQGLPPPGARSDQGLPLSRAGPDQTLPRPSPGRAGTWFRPAPDLFQSCPRPTPDLPQSCPRPAPGTWSIASTWTRSWSGSIELLEGNLQTLIRTCPRSRQTLIRTWVRLEQVDQVLAPDLP